MAGAFVEALRTAFARPARVEAAASSVPVARVPGVFGVQGWGTGGARLAPFEWAPPAVTGWDRGAAVTVPTISRARDLLCTAVGNLPLTLWRVDDRYEPTEQLPAAAWMHRPDPNRTRQWLLAWTTDDLFFHGVAYWRITRRYADTGYPASFVRMPPTDISLVNDVEVRWRSEKVDPADVVQFLSPLDGMLAVGWRAIDTALQLDAAANRFAACEIPAGIVKQIGGEPLAADAFSAMLADFALHRRTNAIAGLNETLEYQESTMDPSRLQLVEARDHQALELSRLANIPPYLVGAPTGSSFTYQNAEQARSDLIDFGAMPYIACIEQTLSGPNVTPITQAVALDIEGWLRSPFTGTPDQATPPLAPTPEVTE